MLSFFSIFGIQNNERLRYTFRWTVVNCFHFSVSLGYKTTNCLEAHDLERLWIAFIFQYLWDTKQLDQFVLFFSNCCELLSFFSIFGIQNNLNIFIACFNYVVNCFHFSVSLGYKTTLSKHTHRDTELWIAFIFQYLWDTKQPSIIVSGGKPCCELLSFFSIFGIQNNSCIVANLFGTVVNCFHFSVSLGYKTTLSNWTNWATQLWIAFIFQYLWDTKQQNCFTCFKLCSCELLSFFSIFGIQNNLLPSDIVDTVVVNCFHFSVSLGYKTTRTAYSMCFSKLWIAFIFQYLWDTKQQTSG